MVSHDPASCWQCLYFSLKTKPDLARTGQAVCGYLLIQAISVRKWSDRACGGFADDAAGRAARERWVDGLRK